MKTSSVECQGHQGNRLNYFPGVSGLFSTITIIKARSHCSDNDNDNDHDALVELLHAEYAPAHSTNGMRSLGVVIVIVIAAVESGL